MIFNMTSGSGSELNFTVKAYASETELLAAVPKENTIGIITTTQITSWIFSATEPETPANGIVWIYTGMGSPIEFNALKKNGVQVYPISAKQYVNGAWVDVTAMSYQNGEWTEWIDSSKLYYYNKQKYKWIVTAEKMNSTSGTITPTVTYNNDGSVTLTINPGGITKSCMFRLEDVFDMRDYSLLTIETGDGIDDTVQALVVYEDGDYWGKPGSDYNGEALAYKALSPNRTYTLPVSSINKTCRIGVGLYSASKLTVTLKSLTIE